jgi:crossover junction endodeoxyribonuclease RuvC
VSGAIAAPAPAAFPDKLLAIYRRLSAVLAECRPDCVAVETVFYANNVRSALKLGHARGVAVLAAVEAGLPVVEYTPAEIKRAVVGYGRAEKHQVQQMVKLLLGLAEAPSPHDAADALAVAICHVHSHPPQRVMSAVEAARAAAGDTPMPPAHAAGGPSPRRRAASSWRQYRPAR